MNCEQARDALAAGDPSARAHLESCPACRDWAARLEDLPRRLAAWHAPDLPQGFEAAVLAALPERKKRVVGWRLVAAEFLIFALGSLAGFGAVRILRPEPPPVARATDPAALGGGSDLADYVIGE